MNETWSVYNQKTGAKICECGSESDADLMVEFDSNYRIKRKNQLLMDQVIDVSCSTDKQLPGQLGLPSCKCKRLKENIDVLIDLS